MMQDLQTIRRDAREAVNLWRTLLLGKHRDTYLDHIIEGLRAALELEWNDWVEATHRAMVDWIESDRFLDVAAQYSEASMIPSRLAFLTMTRADMIFEKVFSARWNSLVWAVVMRRLTGYRSRLRESAERILTNTTRMVGALIATAPNPTKKKPKIRRDSNLSVAQDDETG